MEHTTSGGDDAPGDPVEPPGESPKGDATSPWTPPLPPDPTETPGDEGEVTEVQLDLAAPISTTPADDTPEYTSASLPSHPEVGDAAAVFAVAPTAEVVGPAAAVIPPVPPTLQVAPATAAEPGAFPPFIPERRDDARRGADGRRWNDPLPSREPAIGLPGLGGRSAPDRPLYRYPADRAVVSQPARRSRSTAFLAVLAGLIGAAVTAAALWGLGAFDRGSTAAAPSPSGTSVVERVTTQIITADGGVTPNAVAVARKVVPSIVTIEVGSDAGTGFTAFGSGSGVVLSTDGYIATNNHVVEDAQDTRVIFQDGRIYQATVIGTDAITDLAVVKIEAANLVPIEIGDTATLEIGATAIAVGNPLGLNGGASLTVGVLSAFNREVSVGSGANDDLYGMLQTDAPITQGSSGGALVDGQGRLIGITTAIGVSSAGAEGIGFAIPVDLVMRITDEIIETGVVHHAFLGVQGQDFTEVDADGAIVPAGAVVVSFPDASSAAATSGLEVGDRIVGYDGVEVRAMQDLVNGLRRYRVGDSVAFDIIRDGEPFSVTIQLGERPDGL